MVKIGNNLIINADDIFEKKLCPLDKYIVLTCGLKLNSTVTASSISDEGFTFCLQRSIYTLKNKVLSPQEFNVKWSKKPDEIYPLLASVTTMLLCDINPSVFEIIEF